MTPRWRARMHACMQRAAAAVHGAVVPLIAGMRSCMPRGSHPTRMLSSVRLACHVYRVPVAAGVATLVCPTSVACLPRPFMGTFLLYNGWDSRVLLCFSALTNQWGMLSCRLVICLSCA